MAEGGEVSHFCGTDRMHEPQCEYFADGGEAAAAAEGPVAPDGSIPVDQFVSQDQAYGSPGQAILAGAERAGEGLFGPLAPLAETKLLGINPEEIKERREAYPVSGAIAEGAGLILGPEARALSAAGQGAAKLAGVEGIKAIATRLGVENALYAVGDELSKAIRNDPSTIQAAAAHVGLAGLIGAGAGVPLGMAGKAWEKIAPKAEAFVQDFTGGLRSRVADSVATAEEEPIKNFFRPGVSPLKTSRFAEAAEEAEPPAPETAPSQGSRAADKFADYVSNLASDVVGSGTGAAVGRMTGIPGAATLGAWIGHNSLKPIVKTFLPSIIKPLLTSEASARGLKAAFDAMEAISSGEAAMNRAAESLFAAGTSGVTAPDHSDLHDLDEELHALQERPDAMLNIGGQLGHYMPVHQTALAETAQNAVNYLNAKRPMPAKPGILNTDIPPAAADINAYYRSLGIAQQPLMVLDYLKQGTLKPQDVQDLQSLYPALVPAIMNKVNKQMIDHMSTGQKVPFKMRWGLSMLMGQPMDALFTPQTIQAAQATHLPAQPLAQAKPTPKGRASGINKLGKSVQLAQTPLEARQEALNKA